MTERKKDKEEWLGVGVEAGRGWELPPLLAPAALAAPCNGTVCSDAQRAGTCCSVMIQPLSATAFTRQDAVATVAAASPAAAAAAAAAASGLAFAFTSSA